MEKKQWGVYVHIPFCRKKCFYCDFPSYAGREGDREEYTRALCREIRSQGSSYRLRWGDPATIYIGGGTPTSLPPQCMRDILNALSETFPPSEGREFTVECNPGTVDEVYFQILREGAVNRLSFGVQSFNDRLLRAIGRIHTAEEAVAAVRAARKAGFTNISLDLMYGLPGQTMADLEQSVQQALELAPQHLSIYGLQIEEHTVFWDRRERGELRLPDDEEAERMYDYMISVLPAHGYARYEISNFARPGFASRHNLSYWQDVPYLGLGVAAHSYLDGRRWESEEDLSRYIEQAAQGIRPVHPEEEMTDAVAMEEFCFLALRTTAGISRRRFAEKFGQELERVYEGPIREMAQKGLLAEAGDSVHLTELGMKFGNLVFEAFLLT